MSDNVEIINLMRIEKEVSMPFFVNISIYPSSKQPIRKLVVDGILIKTKADIPNELMVEYISIKSNGRTEKNRCKLSTGCFETGEDIKSIRLNAQVSLKPDDVLQIYIYDLKATNMQFLKHSSRTDSSSAIFTTCVSATKGRKTYDVQEESSPLFSVSAKLKTFFVEFNPYLDAVYLKGFSVNYLSCAHLILSRFGNDVGSRIMTFCGYDYFEKVMKSLLSQLLERLNLTEKIVDLKKLLL
eukprot:maker-scaffold_2-snap-gene-12.2-mRNA-1 protein AED:0.00 eAED:0.00 QI:93/1/1/1/1/1/2/482/240